jgi:tRNA(Ile2) C34 agmatinyltransferase TiaS
MSETKMVDAKGAEYVAAWPAQIAKQTGRTVDEVLAIAEKCYPGVEIGQYVGWQAKWVLQSVKALTPPTCHYCGLTLNHAGECDECGPNPFPAGL